MSKSHTLSLLLAIVLFITTYKLAETRIKLEDVANSSTTKRDAILEVIHNRKSVRHYLDKSVSKEDLLTIMKAGMAAPSGIDKRPWEFIPITSSNKLIAIKQKDAKAAIVVCANMHKTDERAPEFWITDTSVATQNMLLAIEGMGLGAVWKSVYPWKDYTEHIKYELKLPEHVVPLCVITLGYPTGKDKPKDKFDPNNIHWEEWRE